jgi:hypothetical protein
MEIFAFMKFLAIICDNLFGFEEKNIKWCYHIMDEWR